MKKKSNLVYGLLALLLTAAPAHAAPMSLNFLANVGSDSVSGTWSWDSAQPTFNSGSFYETFISLTRFAVNSHDFINSADEYCTTHVRLSTSLGDAGVDPYTSLFFEGGLPSIQLVDAFTGHVSRFTGLTAWIHLMPASLGGSPLGLPQDLNFLSAVTGASLGIDTRGSGDGYGHGGAGAMTLSGATPVPEPGTLILIGTGVVSMAARYRRRRSQSSMQ